MKIMEFTNVIRKDRDNNNFSFYISLGRLFKQAQNNKRNLCVCLSIEHLDYAAVLTALGISDSLYRESYSSKSTRLNIEKGTLVFIKENQSREKAYEYMGVDNAGHPVFKSRGRNPVTLTFYNEERWENVRVAPSQIKYKNNRYSNKDSTNKIVDFYKDYNIDEVLQDAMLKFVIVGKVKKLINEAELEVEDNLKIRDIALFSNLVKNQDPFIGAIVSSVDNLEMKAINSNTILIYDGVKRFLEDGYKYMENPKIIFLERIAEEEKIIEALSYIYEFQNKSDDEFIRYVTSNSKIIPRNIELVSWS